MDAPSNKCDKQVDKEIENVNIVLKTEEIRYEKPSSEINGHCCGADDFLNDSDSESERKAILKDLHRISDTDIEPKEEQPYTKEGEFTECDCDLGDQDLDSVLVTSCDDCNKHVAGKNMGTKNETDGKSVVEMQAIQYKKNSAEVNDHNYQGNDSLNDSEEQPHINIGGYAKSKSYLGNDELNIPLVTSYSTVEEAKTINADAPCGECDKQEEQPHINAGGYTKIESELDEDEFKSVLITSYSTVEEAMILNADVSCDVYDKQVLERGIRMYTEANGFNILETGAIHYQKPFSEIMAYHYKTDDFLDEDDTEIDNKKSIINGICRMLDTDSEQHEHHYTSREGGYTKSNSDQSDDTVEFVLVTRSNTVREAVITNTNASCNECDKQVLDRYMRMDTEASGKNVGKTDLIQYEKLSWAVEVHYHQADDFLHRCHMLDIDNEQQEVCSYISIKEHNAKDNSELGYEFDCVLETDEEAKSNMDAKSSKDVHDKEMEENGTNERNVSGTETIHCGKPFSEGNAHHYHVYDFLDDSDVESDNEISIKKDLYRLLDTDNEPNETHPHTNREGCIEDESNLVPGITMSDENETGKYYVQYLGRMNEEKNVGRTFGSLLSYTERYLEGEILASEIYNSNFKDFMFTLRSELSDAAFHERSFPETSTAEAQKQEGWDRAETQESGYDPAFLSTTSEEDQGQQDGNMWWQQKNAETASRSYDNNVYRRKRRLLQQKRNYFYADNAEAAYGEYEDDEDYDVCELTGRHIPKKNHKTAEEINREMQAMKIHGLHYETDDFLTDSDSGKSSFDEEYYRYKPKPMPIDPDRIVVIERNPNEEVIPEFDPADAPRDQHGAAEIDWVVVQPEEKLSENDAGWVVVEPEGEQNAQSVYSNTEWVVLGPEGDTATTHNNKSKSRRQKRKSNQHSTKHSIQRFNEQNSTEKGEAAGITEFTEKLEVDKIDDRKKDEANSEDSVKKKKDLENKAFYDITNIEELYASIDQHQETIKSYKMMRDQLRLLRGLFNDHSDSFEGMNCQNHMGTTVQETGEPPSENEVTHTGIRIDGNSLDDPTFYYLENLKGDSLELEVGPKMETKCEQSESEILARNNEVNNHPEEIETMDTENHSEEHSMNNEIEDDSTKVLTESEFGIDKSRVEWSLCGDQTEDEKIFIPSNARTWKSFFTNIFCWCMRTKNN